MRRRELLKGLAAGAGALAVGNLHLARALGQEAGADKGKPGPRAKPNIVFILADDLGWMDVSCNGQTRWKTPHIDRLARMGVRFTQAYAAAPLCSPTRGSVLSGKYPARTHFTGITPNMALRSLKQGKLYRTPDNADVWPAVSLDMLPMEEFTFAEALREGGYRTCLIGKYHVGGHARQAREQGFDEIYEFDHRNSQKRFDEDGRFCTDLKGDAALAFMEAQKDRPFMLYLCTNAVHTRIAARREDEEMFLRQGLPAEGPWNAKYAGFVKAIDDNVGRILDKIDSLGIAENTIVMFMSDNGALGGDVASNKPLRGNKAQLYEGGIREPMIVHWPGVTRPGSTCETPVTSVDFYPSMLEMAGLDLRPRQHVDGRSFVGLLRGKDQPGRAMYWHYPHYSKHGIAPSSAIREGDWKLIRFYSRYRPDLPEGRTDEPAVELYNLSEDPYETTDLAQSQAGKTKELLAKLDRYLQSVGACLPIENPDYQPSKPFTPSRGRYLELPKDRLPREYMKEKS
jgi:arylsulfatase A-like enzyme